MAFANSTAAAAFFTLASALLRAVRAESRLAWLMTLLFVSLVLRSKIRSVSSLAAFAARRPASASLMETSPAFICSEIRSTVALGGCETVAGGFDRQAVVAVIDAEQNIPFSHIGVVIPLDGGHIARHLGQDDGDIGIHISVVSGFHEPAVGPPRVPFIGTCGKTGGKKHQQDNSAPCFFPGLRRNRHCRLGFSGLYGVIGRSGLSRRSRRLGILRFCAHR